MFIYIIKIKRITIYFFFNKFFFSENLKKMVKTKELTAMIFQAKINLHTLSWPAQSTDLNPIENLWAEVKKSI